MSKNCKVCLSHNCLEYDSLRIDGKPIKDISEYSKSKYNEGLEYDNFQKHFSRHLKPYIQQEVKLRKLRVELITTIETQLETLAQIQSNLSIIKDVITESSKLSNIVKSHIL